MFKIFLFSSVIAPFIFSMAFATVQNSPEQKAVFFGHNMTPATDMIQPGNWTFGTYAIAVGLPGSFFIATSPWIWTSYNAANLHLKWSHQMNDDSSFGFFASYFQTYNSQDLTQPTNRYVHNPQANLPPGTPDRIVDLERYQWQSTSIHALYSHKFSLDTKTYFSFKYSYFFNEDYPFSIRMDPGDDSTPAQLDLTSLTMIRLDEHFHLGVEGGSIGLNYHAPYLHLGSSFSYLTKSWLFLAGVSYTAQFKEIFKMSAWTPGRYDDRIHISTTTDDPYNGRYLFTALHPELQIQYYF